VRRGVVVAAHPFSKLSKLDFFMKISLPAALMALVPHLQSAILLFVRITMGWGFFLTGRGKLMNLDKTARFFDSLHLPLPKFQAVLAGSTEMVGGLLLLVGLGTRLISAPLAFTMVVAYLTAHREDAFLSLSDFTDQAPFPFLMAALVTIAFGAGRIALDHLLKPWFDKLPYQNRL
jgi:putative oxidoreductase